MTRSMTRRTCPPRVTPIARCRRCPPRHGPTAVAWTGPTAIVIGWPGSKRIYYGQVTHVDQAVGQVLDTLDELGLADDTAVIFCSDHGEMLGDHGLSQKNTPYEASLRIPLLLRWPGRVPPATRCDAPVDLTDVMPTLIDELKLPYPQGLPPLPGSSLVDAAHGTGPADRDFSVIDFGHDQQRWVCLRNAERKYVYWACGGREEAYDLAADPEERVNLALADPVPSWIAAWRRRALEWEIEQGLGRRSVVAGGFRRWPEPVEVPAEDFGFVSINDGVWADRLPADHPHRVESFAQAFDRAIAKESTLSPDKLSVSAYLAQGGSLRGTVWDPERPTDLGK